MRRRHRAAPVTLALLATLAASCAASRKPAPAPPCPERAATAPAAAICGRDQAIQSVRARFRADVQTSDAKRSAEGVLAWRAPGEMRVKLFTLAGLTVYDALLVGDGERVRGYVRQPLSDRDDHFDLGPGESLATPDADLSLVLWSLWRPRCTTPPRPSPDADGSYVLDPAPARVLARDVTVAYSMVVEERLTRPRPGGAGHEVVVARYANQDCAQAASLPGRIEIEAPASGWRASVTIVDLARNVPLDSALFALPATTSSDAGR